MTVGPRAWETLWPQVNRVVEGLRDGLGDTIGDHLVGLHVRGSLSPYPAALRSDIVAR